MRRSGLATSLLVLLSSCSAASRESGAESGADSGTHSSFAPSAGSSSGADMDAAGVSSPTTDDDSSPALPASEASTSAAPPEASASAAPDFSSCSPSPAAGDFPLDVGAVLMAVCQHCHKNPPVNHAPFELLNYEDTQQLIGGIPRWQDMYRVIQPGSVPHMPPPTVSPLTNDQFKTLSDWLAACAVPVPEGTGGDADRDASASGAQTDGGKRD